LQFSLRTIFLAFILFALSLAGYLAWDRHRNTWVVVDTDAPSILRMGHGCLENGDFLAIDTYGLMIRNGNESQYLLWDNGTNPYGLEAGDKFLFAESISGRYYDTLLDGYYAAPEDIIHLDRKKRGITMR